MTAHSAEVAANSRALILNVTMACRISDLGYNYRNAADTFPLAINSAILAKS